MMRNTLKSQWKKLSKTSKLLMFFAVFFVFVACIFGVFSTSYAIDVPDKLTSSIKELDGDVGVINLFPTLQGEDRIVSTGAYLATDSNDNTYYMYCLEKNKEWYSDREVTLGGKLDVGYTYIIQNGFPTKELTGDVDYDYYLTQVAVWLYQDRTVDDSIFNSTQEEAIMSSSYYRYIEPLVTGAINAKENYQDVKPEFSITSSDFHLDSTGEYLETDLISVTSNLSEFTYEVAVDMAGVKVLDSNGNVINQAISSEEDFFLQIPLASLTTTDLDLEVRVIMNYQEYEAYQYLPPADTPDMQQAISSLITLVDKTSDLATTVSIPTGSLEISKIDSSNSSYLAGAVIEVRRDINHSLVERFTTDGSLHRISNLLPGRYTITEVSAPDGYLVSGNTQSVVIDTSRLSVSVGLENSPIHMKIEKVDKETKERLLGAEIQILDESGDEVYRFTSGNSPTTLPTLAVGRYRAVEVKAPDGYYLNTEPVSFEVKDDTTSLSVVMEDVKNEVDIIKVDGDSGEALAGATLRVINADTGSVIKEWVSTTESYSISGLLPGNYRVEEISAPDGYSLSETVMPFTISNTMSSKITIRFPNTKSDISIAKVDEEGNYLAGAVLGIYDDGGALVTKVETKEQPVSLEDLTVGNYTVREIEAPDGYQLAKEEVSFTITPTTDNLLVTMKNIKNQVSFLKVDQDTKESVVGAKLRLVDEEGEVVAEWVSDRSPHVIYGLKKGIYYFEEVEAPSGYIHNTERQRVVIDRDTTTLTYKMTNQKALVRIAKVDRDTNELVPGATLQLAKKDGTVIDTWETTTSYFEFDHLTEGEYVVTELDAPSGYVVSDEVFNFTLDLEHPSVTVLFSNQKTHIRVGKVDSTTGDYVAGASMKITAQSRGNAFSYSFVSEDKATDVYGIPEGNYVLEEIKAPEGYISSGSRIHFYVSSRGEVQNIRLESNIHTIQIRDRRIYITTDQAGYEFQLYNQEGGLVDTYLLEKDEFISSPLENGTYTLKETKVPEGVVLNSNPFTFTISDDTSDIIYFANDFTKVSIDKKEMVGGDSLSGAHFILRNQEGNLVSEWDSTSIPKVIERLSPGTYTLSEVKAPDGYQKRDSLLTFEVEEVGDIQEVTMYDYLEVEVPNTSQHAFLYFILGFIAIMMGVSVFGYVYMKRYQ